MTTKVQRWGNSLALRIPKSFAKDIHVENGDEVNMTIRDGRLVIERLPGAKYNLKDLLSGISAKNLHASMDVDGPIGKEVW